MDLGGSGAVAGWWSGAVWWSDATVGGGADTIWAVRGDGGGDGKEKLEILRARKGMVWSGAETELQAGVGGSFFSDGLEQVRQKGLD